MTDAMRDVEVVCQCLVVDSGVPHRLTSFIIGRIIRGITTALRMMMDTEILVRWDFWNLSLVTCLEMAIQMVTWRRGAWL